MGATTNIFGFFYKIGSHDFPLNSNPNDKFGWDIDASGSVSQTTSNAVFNYSINEVSKAFTKVRQLQRESFYEANSTAFTNETSLTNLIDVFLVETGNAVNSSTKVGTDYTTQAIGSLNVEDKLLTAIFQCLEYLYSNQSSISLANDKYSEADNNGDSALGYETLSNGVTRNPYYVQQYVRHSLIISPSTLNGRVQYVQFSVLDSDNTNVTVTAYFDANAFVERSGNVSYAVYRYVDLDDDSVISSNEFGSQIISPIFSILSEGKYKSWSQISVTKRTGDNSYVEEDFFIFSSLNKTITSTVAYEQIRNYLDNIYSDDTYKRFTYPTLYGQSSTTLIPVWDNQITTSDGTIRDVHAVSLAKISSLLSSLGYSINTGASSYKSTEVFYIGPGAGWTQSVNVNFVVPILAIETGDNSGVTEPISARFPDYQPIYGQNLKTDAAEFHYILLSILAYLKNPTNVLADSFKNSYSIVVGTESGSSSDASGSTTSNRKSVSFTFAGVTWTVLGYLNSSAS